MGSSLLQTSCPEKISYLKSHYKHAIVDKTVGFINRVLHYIGIHAEKLTVATNHIYKK